MALSDMQIYNTEIQTNTIELLGQKTEKFNAASGGTILLNSTPYEGSFSKEAFWAQIASAQRRVDRNAAQAPATATDMSQAEIVGVKVAGGFGPVRFEPSQLTWLQRNPGEAITAISEGFSDALLADQLNTCVLSAVAATEGQAAVVNDVTGGGVVDYINLNGSHAKFGDSSQMLRADVMSGASYHALVDNALNNSNELFQSGNVLVVDILGKLVVVSDIPALTESGPTVNKVLSVVPNGIEVSDNSDLVTNMDTENGQTRIETTWQADYTFNVKLKGYAWDTAAGSSPNDAALGTSANWVKAVTEDKHLLGTLLKAD